jgi:hypothetical protein
MFLENENRFLKIRKKLKHEININKTEVKAKNMKKEWKK